MENEAQISLTRKIRGRLSASFFSGSFRNSSDRPNGGPIRASGPTANVAEAIYGAGRISGILSRTTDCLDPSAADESMLVKSMTASTCDNGVRSESTHDGIHED